MISNDCPLALLTVPGTAPASFIAKPLDDITAAHGCDQANPSTPRSSGAMLQSVAVANDLKLPVRRGGLVLALIGMIAVPLAFAGGLALLSRDTGAPPPLARLELTDEPREMSLVAPQSGGIEFWTAMTIEETTSHRKVDLLRYEIRVTQEGKSTAELSCNPFKASVYSRKERSGGRLEVEHDIDDCVAFAPAGAPLTLTARRVWGKKIEGVSLPRTELIVRPASR